MKILIEIDMLPIEEFTKINNKNNNSNNNLNKIPTHQPANNYLVR